MAKGSGKGRRRSDKQVSAAEDKTESSGDMEEAKENTKIWTLTTVFGPDKDSSSVACGMEQCSNIAVAVWCSGDPNDDMTVCESCQEIKYGGWPEGMEPSCEDEPKTTTGSDANDDEENDVVMQVETSSPEVKTKVDGEMEEKGEIKDQDSENVDDDDDDDGEDEVWDLKKILSIAEISQKCPIKCSHDDCPLPAAVAWVSDQAPTTKWYSCLDHQENDFGGWPELDELPLKHMSKEHLGILASKCSSKSDIAMPIFPEMASPGGASPVAFSNTVTPGPRAQIDLDAADHDMNTITPSPGFALKEANATKAAKTKPPVSKKQLDMHRQWQTTAETMGGPNARIIVSKTEAKKLISDALHDAFAPMNITDLHKALKGVVPSPVLKQCLNDMTLEKLDDENMFAESDDEDGPKEPKNKAAPTKSDPSNDPYAKSLTVKAAKTANATLYYTDHKKLANDGNGLDPEARNQLLSEHAKTKSELTHIQDNVKAMFGQAAILITEPTNEDAASDLGLGESELKALEAQLEAARGLMANEKHKLQIKRRIEHMASFWRKRKRLTMEFLISMEECTDGVVSAKKCLSGDGQIDLESDEVAIKNSTAYYMNMKNRPSMKQGMANKKTKTTASAGMKPTANFVAVMLDSIGCVDRVYIKDDEK